MSAQLDCDSLGYVVVYGINLLFPWDLLFGLTTAASADASTEFRWELLSCFKPVLHNDHVPLSFAVLTPHSAIPSRYSYPCVAIVTL